MRYEITIRELQEFSDEELKEEQRREKFGMDRPYPRYADKLFHEVRVLQAELSKEEFQAVKKAVIDIF